jgi:glycosyltransferase involved in cell wall biosynthesis
MKIVHVLPSLARGGGERLAIELANRQVAAGHEVAFVIGSRLPASMTHDGLDDRVTTHFVTSDRGRTRYRALLPWIWRKRAWLSSSDILHCHLTYGALFGTVLHGILRVPRRPAIIETYHAVGMPIPRALRWLHARLARNWDGLTLMVDDPYWSEFSGSNSNVLFKVIPVGVEALPPVSAGDRLAYRTILGIPHDAVVVTTIGRLVAERRPRSYVPVFTRIAKFIEGEVQFLMGGDGPERRAIEADADAAGILDRLHLPGLITKVEMPLAISNLYVTANVGPVPGVAGLQAVAAGIPVIAVQLSPDFESRASDWIWSSRDPDEIADKAVAILSNRGAGSELASRQHAYLEAHHSAAAMASAYEDFYSEAIARLGSV